MAKYKIYVPTLVDNVKIKFSISYCKETYSYATYKQRPKGYYVNAVPVTIKQSEGFSIEEFGAFTGFNDCLLECDRQSKKRFETSVLLLQTNMEAYIQFFKDKGHEFTTEIVDLVREIA